MPILIDYNQAVIASTSVACKNSNEPTVAIVRHMFLSSLADWRNKYKNKYGELIVCCDSGEYWRKDLFPYYKASRKDLRKNSKFVDWDLAKEAINTVRDELIEYFPYKTLIVDKTEADDIIAVLCKYFSENEFEKTGLVKSPQQVMIVSSDHDFKQLQYYGNVSQYSPLTKKDIREPEPLLYLREHTMKGDRGDGIPNILSHDDALVNPSKRQAPMRKTMIDTWADYDDPSQIPNVNSEHVRNFQRNQQLVDLINGIPDTYQEQIIEAYHNATQAPRGRLLNFFIKKRLSVLTERLTEF